MKETYNSLYYVIVLVIVQVARSQLLGFVKVEGFDKM